MRRRFVSMTLLLGLLTVFTLSVAHADWNGLVDVAEKAETNKKDQADTAYNEMQNANALYSQASSEYAANQAAINRGVVVTSAKLLAATVTVYMSGGVTTTVAVSSLVDMLGLGEAIRNSTSLESAYESAIGAKSSYLSDFESAVSVYNRKYDAYISTLASHTGWTSQQVLNLIGDGSNPVVYHRGSVTPSDVHGGLSRKDWGSYDKSLPSFTCAGPCSDTFALPSSARTGHQKKCGTAEDVGVEATRSIPLNQGQYRAEIDRILRDRKAKHGCGRKYYDCPDHPDTRHKLQTCRKWLWAYSLLDFRDVRSSRCGDSFRACMGHTKDHRGTWWSFATSHSASPSDDHMSVGSYLHDPDDPNGIYNTSDNTPSASLSVSSSSVSTYQSVSFSLSTDTAFDSVTWYVKSQGSSGLGSPVKTDNGSSSSYSGSLSYSFSSSGDYVVTANITDHSDGSTYQASATVNVSSSYSNNDNTPDCSSCTDGCSSCPSSDDSGSDDSSDDSSSDDSSSGTTCSDCNHPYWEGGDAYNSPSLHETVTCRYCGESFKPCTNTAICYSNPSYGSNHSSTD